MKNKIKKLFTNIRVIILLSFLVLAVVAINPKSNTEGVAIRSVVDNSSAYLAGIKSPDEKTSPTGRERIITIDNRKIDSLETYYSYTDSLSPGRNIKVETNKNSYFVSINPEYKIDVLKETEIKLVNKTIIVNETINGTIIPINKTITNEVVVNKTNRTIIGKEPIGLKADEPASTNIIKGLDIAGGTRVLLTPEEELSKDKMDILIQNMKQRLNVYGLSDIVVKPTKDLSGKQFIVVEIAGVKEEEVKSLISKQGKFEAKIGKNVVFNGGDKDITYVCRTTQCSGIAMEGCGQTSEGDYACRFRFSITLKPEAARRMANITDNLSIVTTDENGNPFPGDERYLSKKIELFLDDSKVDALNIGADLKGRVVTDISISGSGSGQTEQDAAKDALKNMKKLQTILITGSLPTKLNIEKIDTLSPALGEEFLKNAIIIAFSSIIAVGAVVFIRFRKFFVTIPMMITMTSEIILLLGTAALIGWNIDLSAIAGIIIAVGTGVDDQVIIADEILSGKKQYYSNWKTKIKNAFFIIMAAYFTTVVAMIPLYSAGAGLLRGFSIITILGVTYGVFVTRPAYAAIMEIFFNE